MYISGDISLSVGLNNKPIAIELVGTGTQLVSYIGGLGYSITISAAPSIALLDGAININLAAVAEATSSLYFKYVNPNDFTVALQATLTINPSNFLSASAAKRFCNLLACSANFALKSQDTAHPQCPLGRLLSTCALIMSHCPDPAQPSVQPPWCPTCPPWSRRRWASSSTWHPSGALTSMPTWPPGGGAPPCRSKAPGPRGSVHCWVPSP